MRDERSAPTSRRRAAAVGVLSPEARLVLLAAGEGDNDEAIRAMLPLVRDWRRVLALSLLEGAQPIVGRCLRRIGDGVPVDILEQLRQLERVAALRQLHLHRRMLDALTVLSRARIPVVLLKGAAMAHVTYGSFLDRPMSDVDLLVHADRAEEARALLLLSGWRERFESALHGLYAGMHHLPPMVDDRVPSLGVGLELHVDVMPEDRNPFSFSAGDIWRRAAPATDLPEGTRVPDVVQRVLHCCFHFAWLHMMRASAWRTVRDLGAVARSGELDWSDLVTAAIDSGGSAVCYWTLRLARSLAAVPVPDLVLARLRPAWPSFAIDLLERHFVSGCIDAERLCPSDGLQQLLWRRAMRPRARMGGDASWREDARPWHLLHGGHVASRGAEMHDRRGVATSVSAWRRYLGSLMTGDSELPADRSSMSAAFES